MVIGIMKMIIWQLEFEKRLNIMLNLEENKW